MVQESPAASPGASNDEEAGTCGLRRLVEQAFLLGVGVASLTLDRVQSVIDEFVARGRVSGEDGRALAARLAAKSREEARGVVSRVDKSLRGTYRDLGLVTKNDLEELEFRLRQIEHRLQLLEAREDQCTDNAVS